MHCFTYWFGLLMMLGLLASCQVGDAVSPTEGSVCAPFEVSDALTCVHDGSVFLVQAQGNMQGQLIHENAQITLTGTLHLRSDEMMLSIANLGGQAFISVGGVTQFIGQGGVLRVSYTSDGYQLEDRRAVPLSDEILREDLLLQLPVWVTLPAPIAPPHHYTPLAPMVTTTAPDEGAAMTVGCVVQDAWGNHTVRSGDTIGRIAQQYQTTATDLAIGNCLENINRIQVGQVLRVPNQATITPIFAPTGTPSAVLFRADRIDINAGDCTTLRWDVLNVTAVYLDEREVFSVSIEPICPNQTTRYTLQVIYPDGHESSHVVEVRVRDVGE